MHRKADKFLKVLPTINNQNSSRAEILSPSRVPDLSQSQDEIITQSDLSNRFCQITRQESLRLLDTNQSISRSTSPTIGVSLNFTIVAYVTGLGFGLMSALVNWLNISAYSFDQGIFDLDWKSENIFLISCKCKHF